MAADETHLPEEPTTKRRRRQIVYSRASSTVLEQSGQLQLQLTPIQQFDPDLQPSASAKVPEEGEDFRKVPPKPTPFEEIASRAYPHVYDPKGPAGAALALLRDSEMETAKMVALYLAGDLGEVASRLSIVAALMAKAYPQTDFNPSLGALVSFIRRATLLADPSAIGQDALMSLAKAARVIASNVMISLDGAADLEMELEAQGWRGADPDVAAFVAVLLGEGEEGQKQDTKLGAADVIGRGLPA